MYGLSVTKSMKYITEAVRGVQRQGDGAGNNSMINEGMSGTVPPPVQEWNGQRHPEASAPSGKNDPRRSGVQSPVRASAGPS